MEPLLPGSYCYPGIADPCFSFTISHTPEQEQSQVIQVLQVVAVSGAYEEELPVVTTSFLEAYGAMLLYVFISAVLFCGLLLSLRKIYVLIRQNAVQQKGRLHLIFTTVKGAPFSFFKYLFWNPGIDMTSEAGQQIFKHELVHIEEKHSLDKLFMQLVLIFCWINPVFWLIRYELRMVHEFIADRKAVEQQDASALAAMILQAAYPQHYSQLTNSFFHQSIKRRLRMLTKIQNPKRNYLSRLLLLPLMALLTLAFTVRTEITNANTYVKAVKNLSLPLSVLSVNRAIEEDTIATQDSSVYKEQLALPAVRYAGDKKVTVVIDAGHGGHDNGANSHNVLEKDIALAIAKEVQALNTNANIQIVLTRNNDDFVQLRDRVAISQKYKADLFISIHTGAVPLNTEAGETEHPKRGFDVFIPRDTVSNIEQSKRLGSAVLQQLNTVKSIPANMQLLQRQIMIWILNKNTCPSILVECGYITNEKDRKFLLQKENQQQVAKKLLAGIEGYLQAADQKSLLVTQRKIDASYISSSIDTLTPPVLMSGDDLTVEQLQNIPFAKLIQPDGNYTMVGAAFSISMGNKIHYVKIIGDEQPQQVKDLIRKAERGNMITVEARKALTKDGKEVKLPSIFYYVK